MMTTLPLPIASDHPSYAGHFPGHPILPGVVLLDQAQRALERTCHVAITGLAQAKFLSPCAPGEALQLDYEHSGTALRFEIRCGARRVASGRFTVAATETLP
jgi:3-hydroxymyristoyl/3-hydroxydecanoyl-(acyl carrier protein) dehydratase